MNMFMFNLWVANEKFLYENQRRAIFLNTLLTKSYPSFTQPPLHPQNIDHQMKILTDLYKVCPSLLKKHPLQHKWTLWFHKKDLKKSWEDNLQEITTFGTVEDFWSLYFHIEFVGNLNAGSDYALFKHGIKPMWEDDKNKKGGRWLVYLNKSQRSSDLESMWLETLLCLIGEAFEENGGEVCGAVVNVRRRGDKIALWTSDSKRYFPIIKIGRTFKERLNIPHFNIIGYQAHTDCMFKSGSVDQYHYTV